MLSIIGAAGMAERSKALESGTREPASIHVSDLLVGFFLTANAEESRMMCLRVNAKKKYWKR